MRFVHLNANGVRPRVDELRRLTRSAFAISVQDTRLRDPDQQALWEEWWPEFHSFFFAHDDGGPGCALLVRSTLRHEVVSRISKDRQRLLSVLVTLPDGWRILLSSLHAAPANPERGGEPLHVDLLRRGLDFPAAVLVGDLNARSELLGCRSSNRSGDVLEAFLGDSGVLVLNDPSVPTFSHSSCDFSDCIDWALATPTAAASFSCSTGMDVGSDHWPLVVQRASSSGVARGTPALPRWRTTGDSWQEPFCASLLQHLHDGGLLPPRTPSTPEQLEAAASSLESAVAASADEVLSRSRPRLDTVLAPPWWLRALITERRKLRRQHAVRPSFELRRQLSDLRRAIRRAVEDARSSLLERKARAFAQGPRVRHFWPAVQRWFANRPPALPPLRLPDGTLAFTPEERTQEFARHLRAALDVPTHPDFEEEAFQETERAIADDLRLLPVPADDDPEDEDLVTRPVSLVEVYRLVQELRPGKAPGPDGVSTDLLRAAPDELGEVLAALFTASLRMGFVPARWRLAWMRLIPKPGKPLTSAVDFRPIALTSCVGKLLERLVARRLLPWCSERGLLPDEQSGFRFGRDAIEQVVLLEQRITQAFNGGLCTAVAALDIAKAYDSVWHAGLLHLCRDTLPPPVTRWIAGFLRDRSAQVLQDGLLSPPFPTPGGVPQGSPLSPLLYVLYTRDMPLPRGPRLGASAYADDVAVWASAASPAAAGRLLEPFLDDLLSWGNRWRLRFSAAKTQLAFFSRRQGGWAEEQLAAPVFCGLQLTWRDEVDLLGVRLDRRLSLLRHVRRTSQRVAPRILHLQRLSSSLRPVPRWVRVLLVKVLIRPCWTFVAPAWTPACDSAWERLEQLDRRAIRAALGEYRDSGVDTILQRARLPSLRSTFQRLGARFLLRHVARANHHLLGAFSTDVRQRPDLLRQDEPLERLLAWVDEEDRTDVVEFVRQAYDPPPRHGAGRASRARFNPPERWGISPW